MTHVVIAHDYFLPFFVWDFFQCFQQPSQNDHEGLSDLCQTDHMNRLAQIPPQGKLCHSPVKCMPLVNMSTWSYYEKMAPAVHPKLCSFTSVLIASGRSSGDCVTQLNHTRITPNKRLCSCRSKYLADYDKL